MSVIFLFAVAGYASIVSAWFGLSLFYGYRYVRPLPWERRRPQTLILAAACLGWVAFLLANRGYITDWGRVVFEAVAYVGAVLAVIALYLYESQQKRNRRTR
jgi:hypothetical protein